MYNIVYKVIGIVYKVFKGVNYDFVGKIGIV